MTIRLQRNRSAAERLRRIVRKSVKRAVKNVEKAIACEREIDEPVGEAVERGTGEAIEKATNDTATRVATGAPLDNPAAVVIQEVLKQTGDGSARSPGAALRGAERRRDKAVHAARQEIKRARSGLRLLRAALGKDRYNRENIALRDAARPLTELRDARVLSDAFAKLAAGDAAGLDPVFLAEVERDLTRRRRAMRQPFHTDGEAHALDARLTPALRALKAVERRVQRWPLVRKDWAAVAAGLEQVYRQGRAALALARRDPSVDHLHECRKQAKYLRYQLEMLQPIRPKLLRPLTDMADKIGEYLGDNHDLALLAEVAKGHDSAAPDAGRLLAMIDQRRDQLASRAGAIGMSLYRRGPKAFVRRLGKPRRAGRHG